MHVSPNCFIVLTVFFKYSVADEDVRNIESCLIEEVVILLKIKSSIPGLVKDTNMAAVTSHRERLGVSLSLPYPCLAKHSESFFSYFFAADSA